MTKTSRSAQLSLAYEARHQIGSRGLRVPPSCVRGSNPFSRTRELYPDHVVARQTLYGPFNRHAMAADGSGVPAPGSRHPKPWYLQPQYQLPRPPMKFGGALRTDFGEKLAVANGEDVDLSGADGNGSARRQRRPPVRRRGDSFRPRLTRAMLRDLLQETNMTRTELYRLYNRFKALCQLSGTPGSINKATFKDGVSSLAFEDDVFVDRVFNLLDDDSNGTVEWAEFVNAVNALETGSSFDKLSFCFRVYDRDNSNTIERQELRDMFSSMLLSAGRPEGPAAPPTAAMKELVEDFTDTIFDSFDLKGSDSLDFEKVLAAVEKNTEMTDVWEVFGRTLVSRI